MPFLSFHSALTLEEVGMLHESCPPNGATREGDPARKQALSLPSPRAQIPTRAPDSSQLLRKSKALLSFICNFFFFFEVVYNWVGCRLKLKNVYYFFFFFNFSSARPGGGAVVSPFGTQGLGGP